MVVSDGGQEVINGIGARWSKPGVGNRPERMRCRWHLAKNPRAALVKDIKPHLVRRWCPGVPAPASGVPLGVACRRWFGTRGVAGPVYGAEVGSACRLGGGRA